MDTNCGSRGTEIVNSKVLASTRHAEPRRDAHARAPSRRDLLPQRIDVGKLAFIPDALHESQPHRTTVEISRVIEQVRLDRQLLLANRRTPADVGDAGVYNAIDRRRRRIDTVRWKEFVVCVKIGRRESDL